MAESLLHGKRFYCREWAFMKLSHCLEQRHASKAGGALILGGAGCGKTALCSELVWPSVHTGQGGYRQRSLHRRLLAYHFCQAHDVSSLSPADFVRHLVQQLKVSELLSPHFEEKLRDPDIANALRPEVCERDPDEAFKKAVLFPLLELDPPKQCCFILVDSIDETNVSGPGEKLERGGSCGSAGSFSMVAGRSKTVGELLANHHQLLPQWILLICTARRYNRGMARMFAGFRKLSLDEVRKANVVKDVQQYILARLDSESALRAHMGRDDTAELLNQLHIKSHGCLLYAERILDAVAANSIVLREIREIPGTLNGLYLWLCQRIFTRKQFSRVQPLINAILAARSPLNESELLGCVKAYQDSISREEFSKRLNVLKRVLVERNGRYLLFHHSFAEWLVDVKHCTQKYLCKTVEGHALIAKSLSNRGSDTTAEEVQTLASHLVRLEGIQDSNRPEHTTVDRHTLALWLVMTDVPVEDCLRSTESSPKDQRALRLLLEAGAKPRVNEIDDIVQIPSDECSPEGSDLDPLADLLRATASGLGQDCEGGGESLTLSGSNSGGSLLHALCAEGNSRLVALLLARGGIDLEAPDSNRTGQTALNLAARHGHAEIVTLLLEAGAEPDHADVDGWTALRSAAWGGHVTTVEILLKRGADVERADAEGRTALRAAAWGGHEEIVLQLLRAGAKVDGCDAEGRTPLIAAAYMSHAEIVEHLLEFGADPDHEDSDGRTALSVAALCVPASEGYTKVANILLEKGASVDHEDRDGMTPLLVAAFEGHKEVCELLLEYEADPEHSDKGGRTPLWAAASMGHCGVVALLLFWGCSVDSIDNEGRTVLSVASAQGSPKVVRLLLDRGLDEMHRDNAGWTPLHYAAFEGHISVCEVLLDAGTKLDETDNDGKTPLMLSSQEGHISVVNLVLQRGANANHRAHCGKTALRLAAVEGHREVVRSLVKAGADPSTKDADGRSTLYVLALENRVSMARCLIAESASFGPPAPPPRGGILTPTSMPLLLDLEGADSEGRTPLHVSAWQGHTDMAALLLDAGADVNATDREKRTALQSASWQGHSAIVRLLMSRSAKVDHTCSQGATALCIAAQEGHVACVKALLQGGADPHHSDRCGRTALRVAAKSGHEEIVRLLEEAAATGAMHHRSKHGGSSNTSMASTVETKPSSAVLMPPSYRSHSPVGGQDVSPDSTSDLKRRSYISVGNQSSSKSSSNFTGSSTKSAHGITLVQQPPARTDLSFTQQLQRASKHRPLSQVLLLSPLSEPQSPIYASPPQSPLSDSSLRNNSPPLPGSKNNHERPTLANSTAINSPFPDTMPVSLAPLSFTQDSHMRIILGNRPLDNSAKVKRNGIVTNPNLKTNSVAGGIKVGLRNGFEAAKKQVTAKCQATRSNGFPWKKETPL